MVDSVVHFRNTVPSDANESPKVFMSRKLDILTKMSKQNTKNDKTAYCSIIIYTILRPVVTTLFT